MRTSKGKRATHCFIATAALMGWVLAGSAQARGYRDGPFNPALTAALPGDRLIVPGQRVGPIQIWDTVDHAETILGPPEFTTPFSSCSNGTNYCVYFYKYVWSKYGLIVYASQSDPRLKIFEIDVYNHATSWETASGVSLATAFKFAIDHITETISPAYATMCFNTGFCGAYDSDGMHIGAFGRDAALNEIQIYDARFDATHQNRIPLGNYPGPNDMMH